MFEKFKLFLTYKDVQKIYNEEKKGTRPVWLSRRLRGLVIQLIGGLLISQFGINTTEVDNLSLTTNNILDSAGTLYDIFITNKEAIVSAVMVVYGGIMQILSYWKGIKREG